MRLIQLILMAMLLASCAQVPENIKPVTGFEVDRYMGQWYEIARLDHSFERGLEKVTAVYTLKEDGTVSVLNKGFRTADNEWSEAEGKARFVVSPDVGHLEVSFFGPFYGDYVIFELDQQNYQYAFITGSENSLWFLSRTPEVEEELKKSFVNQITELGYNAEELIFVNQK